MRGRLTALALLLTLAGCNLAPHYSAPAAGTPARFKEAVAADASGAQGWKIAEPKDRTLRGPWWELYGDPDLAALERRVPEANQNVLAAEAAYRQARALLIEARAGWLPTVSLNPAVTRSRSSVSSGGGAGSAGAPTAAAASGATGTSTFPTGSGSTGGAGTSGGGGTAGVPRTVYSLPLDASYELDLWGRVANTVRADRALAEASAADLASSLLTMQAELAQDYFQLRAVDEQRMLLETALADYRSSLHLADTLFRSGIVSEEDVSQARAQLESAQAQATDLGISRAQFEHAIAVLTGVPPSQFHLAIKRFAPRLPAVPVELPADLLERRPDVAGAERRVAAANAQIGVARAAFFPRLTIGATAGFQATHLGSLFAWPNRFWSIGPSAALSLFDGGARWAEAERAGAAYDQTVAEYRQTVLTAFQAVEDNLVSLRVLAREAAELHLAVVAAEHTVSLAVARYQQGLDSYVNVITAQNIFLTNRQAELQVQLRQAVSSIGLVRNLGGGWGTDALPETEKTARVAPRQVAPDAGGVPSEDIGAVPNPPALPERQKKPEDLLKQDEDLVRPSGPARP